jgi:hypothetical protein
MSSQLWGAVVVIVLGCVLGFYFQSRSIAHLDKRIDDPRAEFNHRFDDLRAASVGRGMKMGGPKYTGWL